MAFVFLSTPGRRYNSHGFALGIDRAVPAGLVSVARDNACRLICIPDSKTSQCTDPFNLKTEILIMSNSVQLIVDLRGSDESTREEIVSQLETCGPPPAELRAELVGQLENPETDPLQCYWCLTLLGRDGDAGSEVEASAIAEQLREGRPIEVRQRAAWALGKCVASSQGSRELLEQAANDPNSRLARLAQHALIVAE